MRYEVEHFFKHVKCIDMSRLKRIKNCVSWSCFEKCLCSKNIFYSVMILLDINISFQIALRNIKLLCFVRILINPTIFTGVQKYIMQIFAKIKDTNLY